MKKLFVIAALFASMVAANAQQFGVTGGLTLSTMNGVSNPKDTKAVALYSAGILYKADLGAGFAIQPELLWQVKGANIQENAGALDNLTVSRSSNVELGLGLQWGPDLLAFRPYIFVEPFLGYSVGGKETQTLANMDFSRDKVLEAKNKLEYGVGAGIGVEIANHVQISCQLFRNMGPLYKTDQLGENKYPYDHLKNYQGMKINLAILF
ncbi:MAG: PorT family protein [Bacteroidales bacterium]|nr:PorT family protein [Bacteroidales bacterium]